MKIIIYVEYDFSFLLNKSQAVYLIFYVRISMKQERIEGAAMGHDLFIS